MEETRIDIAELTMGKTGKVFVFTEDKDTPEIHFGYCQDNKATPQFTEHPEISPGFFRRRELFGLSPANVHDFEGTPEEMRGRVANLVEEKFLALFRETTLPKQ
ncbi:MAG: hypothetical protein ACOX50_04305 [Patescibacteria group bacterium]|jgi:hypothetical protein